MSRCKFPPSATLSSLFPVHHDVLMSRECGPAIIVLHAFLCRNYLVLLAVLDLASHTSNGIRRNAPYFSNCTLFLISPCCAVFSFFLGGGGGGGLLCDWQRAQHGYDT